MDNTTIAHSIDPNYINDYGILNAKEADINAENAPLWTLEYLLMLKDDDRGYSVEFDSLFKNLFRYIKSCRGKNGMFNNMPEFHGNKDDYTSPDQLIAYACFFHLFKVPTHNRDIYRHLLSHFFTYDNMSGKTSFKRTMQPMPIFLLGATSSNFSYIWRFGLSLICLISCFSSPGKTSGKLKAWTIMKSLKMGFTHKLCTFVIGKRSHFKSWGGVFLEYFKEDRNPIRKAIKDCSGCYKNYMSR